MDNPIGFLTGGLESLGIDRQKEQTSPTGDLEQEQFLELMLTQLQNQDPLNPMESGDFLGQIAQFGTVSGIGELQQSFSALAASLQSSQALQASTMVGRKVLIEGQQVQHDGQSESPFAFELPAAANDVRITVTDSLGQVVREIPLGAQNEGLIDTSWDGYDAGGEAVPAGPYIVNVNAVIDGTNQAVPTFIRQTVESVTLPRDGNAPVLNLTDIGAIELSAVKRVL